MSLGYESPAFGISLPPPPTPTRQGFAVYDRLVVRVIKGAPASLDCFRGGALDSLQDRVLLTDTTCCRSLSDMLPQPDDAVLSRHLHGLRERDYREVGENG
eukprot:COSAG01_NODE_8540_length_2747_cov_11.361646_2_plen_101_part_00